MIQQTSIMAYLSEVKPSLGKRQKLVLEAIEEMYPATNKRIGEYLGWPINTVTPRVQELRKLGKVVEAFRADDGGRMAIYWKPMRTSKEYGDAA